MTYVSSAVGAGRGTTIQYSTNPPSVAYAIFAEVKNISFSGAKFDLADVTNFQSSQWREYLPTLGDSGEVSFSGNMIPNDPSEAAIIGFFNNATLVTYQVTLPPTPGFPTNSGVFTFKAYVASIDRTIAVDKPLEISGKLKITGPITFVAGS